MVNWEWWKDFGAIAALSISGMIPSPRWSTEEVPSMVGKVVLITGGNSGIGKETARVLLQCGAKVYLACRSKARAQSAISELEREAANGGQVVFLELDLANFASVRRCAAEFLSHEKKLDILFNNGGVSFTNEMTPDGFDYTFATNVMGHWLLTDLLTPALLAASDSAPSSSGHARVVTVSSRAAYLRQLDFDGFADGPVRKSMNAATLYSQSKLGNVIVAKELARRHGDKVVSLSLHPGVIETEINRHAPPLVKWILNKVYKPVALGALTSLYAGTAPEAAEFNGQYLVPWARLGRMPMGARDPAVGEKLWAWLEEKTGQLA